MENAPKSVSECLSSGPQIISVCVCLRKYCQHRFSNGTVLEMWTPHHVRVSGQENTRMPPHQPYIYKFHIKTRAQKSKEHLSGSLPRNL
eukprot:c476_g1_i2 orf=350-616(+)